MAAIQAANAMMCKALSHKAPSMDGEPFDLGDWGIC
jgi:hypothetical protein